MYKQTDEKIAIYAAVKDKETQQFKTYNVMKKWGCLFVSLLYIVEQASGKYFSPSQIKLAYHYLVLKKMLGKDMYVKDHTAVLTTGLQILGYEDFTVKYCAKQVHNGRDASWGNSVNSNYQLREVRTQLNNHHFKHQNFDPYEPKPKVMQLISERFYEVKLNID